MSIQDRKSRQFHQRGQEILAAALTLFETENWEAVSIEEIARVAEVGKGTVYKHFVSKDEIYARLAMSFQRRVLEGLELVDTTLPLLDRFRAQLEVAWDLHLSSRALHRVFIYCSRAEFRSRLAPAELAGEWLDLERQVAQPTQDLIAAGIDQGIFPQVSVHSLLFSAQSAFWGGVQMVWSGYLGEVDRTHHFAALTSFILAGLIHFEQPLTHPAAPS